MLRVKLLAIVKEQGVGEQVFGIDACCVRGTRRRQCICIEVAVGIKGRLCGMIQCEVNPCIWCKGRYYLEHELVGNLGHA